MRDGLESGLDRLDSVSVRVDDLVKDGAKRRRLRRSSILDKIVNTNNWHPSDQGRPSITLNSTSIAPRLDKPPHAENNGANSRLKITQWRSRRDNENAQPRGHGEARRPLQQAADLSAAEFRRPRHSA